jgi:hypothetical protein
VKKTKERKITEEEEINSSNKQHAKADGTGLYLEQT